MSKERGARATWQETIHLVNNRGPGDRQRKAGKGRNLRRSNVTFCPLRPHYNKIDLVDKKFPSCTDTMTLPIKTK